MSMLTGEDMDITEEQAQDEERKRCEQCQAEKDIGLFRKVTNMYTAVHRMSICKECYITNQKATQQRIEEEFQRRKEEQERLEEQRQQERQSALEQAMRDNPVFCKRCNQLRIDGSHLRPDGSVGYKGKFCEACRDNNPHTIYRMRCPLM